MEAVTAIGLNSLTLKKIVDWIAETPLSKKPKWTTVSRILKEHLNIGYTKLKSETIRYNDCKNDEKRLWVSRLLAQFLHDDIVVISIDEAGF